MLPILDGYTAKAKINVEGWPEFTISYRRALSEAVDDYLERAGKKKIEATIKLWQGRLLSWDVKTNPEAEQPIACTEEAWRQLPYTIREKITEYIAGFSTDPN